MRSPRLTATLVSATLLLGACGVASDVADGIKDVASEAGEAIGETVDEINNGDEGASTSGGEATGQDDDGAAAGESGDSSGVDTTEGAPGLSAETNDLTSVGFHGPAMLRGSVGQLIIEVDVQSGVEVEQGSLDHLVSTIRQVADKPGGVVVSGGNTFESSRTEWTSASMREIAAANRNHYSGNGTVVVYVLYLDGGFFSDGQQTSAIGVAYNASEFGVFPSRWAGLSLLGSDAAIERAVLVHEWGHLLGLVNIGYTSDIDHEDPDHKGHSRNKDSVMYYAIESTLIGQVFQGAPPSTFDDADLADIEGLRSGKYRG